MGTASSRPLGIGYHGTDTDTQLPRIPKAAMAMAERWRWLLVGLVGLANDQIGDGCLTTPSPSIQP